MPYAAFTAAAPADPAAIYQVAKGLTHRRHLVSWPAKAGHPRLPCWEHQSHGRLGQGRPLSRESRSFRYLVLLAPLPAANKLRRNPNVALDPCRGARAGCTCRSPAIHGRLRCSAGQARGQAPHGGRNAGPRTPETLPRRRPVGPPAQRPRGRIRVRDARTVNGNDGANASADNRHRRTLLRIGLVDVALDRHQPRLPFALSANRPPQGAPTPGPTAPFKPSRIDPLNRDPGASPDPGLRRGRLLTSAVAGSRPATRTSLPCSRS
jgi:hypothetical protein